MRTFVGTQQDSQHIGKQRVQGLSIQYVKKLVYLFCSDAREKHALLGERALSA
jgi:hypothetical protein